MTNIYLDENLSEYVAQALNFLNKGYFREIQVFSTKEKFGKGKPDELIIPGIGNDGGILITTGYTSFCFVGQKSMLIKHRHTQAFGSRRPVVSMQSSAIKFIGGKSISRQTEIHAFKRLYTSE